MLKRVRPAGVAALCVPVLVLMACGAPHRHTVETATSALTGRDAAVLTACIGAPLSVASDAGVEVWTYSSAQAEGADGRRLAEPDAGDDAHDDACVYDITVVDGRIAAVDSDNRAGWGFASIADCSALVEPCIDR